MLIEYFECMFVLDSNNIYVGDVRSNLISRVVTVRVCEFE